MVGTDGLPVDSGGPESGSDDWFAVFADPPPPELIRFFDLEGYRWKSVAAAADGGETAESTDWAAVFVSIAEHSISETDSAAGDDTPAAAQAAWRFCGNVRSETTPVMVLIGGSQLDALLGRHDLYDDFIITPFHPEEMRARVGRLLAGTGKGVRGAELITYGPLSLNVETYQAVVDGRALDLTFMEYELLRFLASSPGQVFTRETLLNRVWGYEYYGGARTVDVHVRRLRAKMGEEHSSLITTVRGVGYKLGQSRWQG